MSTLHEIPGDVTTDDTESPYWIQSCGYRSLPGYPHIHLIVDGTEVWDAEQRRALPIYLNTHGYPYVWFAGRSWRLQRLMMAAWHPGSLDDGSFALHKINDRSYVAIWNLYPGGYAENVRDRQRDAKNRAGAVAA